MSRELLENSVESLITVCNDIYRHIDRSEREEISDVDFELVKTFNALVAINQRNIDVLYPNRKKGEVKTLAFRNVRKDIQEVSNEH